MKVGLDSFFFFGKLSIAVGCKKHVLTPLALSRKVTKRQERFFMEKEKNKNKNYPRVFLSGVYNACCGRMSFLKRQYVEYPRLQTSGMVPLFSKGFTLIELLVIVLIIGILSAIALPQYQKAVIKARASQLLIFAKHFNDLCTVDLLAGGACAKLQDIGWDYTIDEYNYDEGTDLESGKVNDFFIEHRDATFSAYDNKSNLTMYVSLRPADSPESRGIHCVAMGHDEKIEKVCQAMGGTKNDKYKNYPNTFYRL